MDHTSEMLKDDNTGAFIEQKCCIKFEDKKFCSGGSYLCQRADNGKYEGLLYGDWKKEELSSWDGTLKIPAIYGREYRNNFGAKCRYVWFKYMDRYFVGRWDGIEWSQIVRVKEISKKGYFRSH